MEPTIQKEGARRQRTPEEIIQLLDEFESSPGITVKEFCEMYDISDATFYNWRKVYRSKNPEQQRTAGFIELIGPAAESISSPGTLFAEVSGIKIYQPVSADYLKTFIL